MRPLGSRKLGSGSLRGHLAQENSARFHFEGHLAREDSARGHFEATWLEEARLGVTSRTLGSGKLGSGLLRGHLARERSARVLSRPLDSLGLPWLCLAGFSFAQFCSTGSAQSGSACLEKTRLGATPKSLGSRLSSGSLRSHLAREKSARVYFDATWLEKTRLRVTSRPHGSRKLGSGSLRGHLAREDSALGCFEATWLEKARLGFFRGHLTRLACLGSAWLDLASLNFAQLGRLSPARPVSTHVA